MLSYIAVYRAMTIATARMIAVATDPALVADVLRQRLRQPAAADEADPADAAIEYGKCQALQSIAQEASAAYVYASRRAKRRPAER